MATLCYITTCKGRLAHLQQTLPRIVGQPDVSCVVVDYSCPDRAGDWVEASYPQVRVVRAGGETRFNASRARNLGAQAADAPWLGFFDADILLSPGFSRDIVPQLVPGFFYRANPVTSQTWGSIICHRDDFAAVGGYDEAYVGWGGEDDDLIAMLILAGKRIAGFAPQLLAEISHTEEQRVDFYDIKNRRIQSRVNQIYFQVKIDLLRILGNPLSAEQKHTLFGEIQRTVLQGESGNRLMPQNVEVDLPVLVIATPPNTGAVEHTSVRRKITYTIAIEPTATVVDSRR